MNGRRNEPPNVKGRHIHQHPSASSHPSLNENAASQHLDKNGTNNSHNSHNSHNNKEKRDNKHELASLDQLHHLIKAMMATLDTAILAAKDMASVSPKHNCSIHDPPIQLTSARLQSDSNNYKLEERGA